MSIYSHYSLKGVEEDASSGPVALSPPHTDTLSVSRYHVDTFQSREAFQNARKSNDASYGEQFNTRHEQKEASTRRWALRTDERFCPEQVREPHL